MEQATDELIQWARGLDQQKESLASIVRSMLHSGWSARACTQVLGAIRPKESGEVLFQGIFPDPQISYNHNEFEVSGQQMQLRSILLRPKIIVIDNFLSSKECDSLIALALPRLARSTTIDYQSDDGKVSDVRTSDGMFFARGEHRLLQDIEERIALFLQWPVEKGEGMQVLRYGPGAQYLPHYDFFEVPSVPVPTGPSGTQEVHPLLKNGGQRVATLLLYLNTPKLGGATVFPNVGFQAQAKKGSACFFNYPLPNAQSLTLHAGAPVIEGEKWVATKWLREGRVVNKSSSAPGVDPSSLPTWGQEKSS